MVADSWCWEWTTLIVVDPLDVDEKMEAYVSDRPSGRS